MSDRTEALKALVPPNMRDMLNHPRAAAGKMFTYDEALTLIENMMATMTRSPRLPIATTTQRQPDGTLTIRVTPTGTP